MSITMVQTYVVHAQKSTEFATLLNEFLKFKKAHPRLFKGLKSWKLYKQDYGQPAGMYMEMQEYEDLAQLEEVTKRVFSDEGMKRISTAFHKLVEPATLSATIWSKVV